MRALLFNTLDMSEIPGFFQVFTISRVRLGFYGFCAIDKLSLYAVTLDNAFLHSTFSKVHLLTTFICHKCST